jgi:hypothetical protein
MAAAAMLRPVKTMSSLPGTVKHRNVTVQHAVNAPPPTGEIRKNPHEHWRLFHVEHF